MINGKLKLLWISSLENCVLHFQFSIYHFSLVHNIKTHLIKE